MSGRLNGPRRGGQRVRVRGCTRFTCACVALLSLSATAVGAQQLGRPRLDAGRLAGETVGGAYAGIAGFLVGRHAGREIGDLMGVESDVTRRRVGNTTGALTSAFATAGVVYAIGSMGDQTGEFDTTLLGTGIGFVAAVGVANLIFAPEGQPSTFSTKGKWAAVNFVALLPAIGATIAFNSTRRFK